MCKWCTHTIQTFNSHKQFILSIQIEIVTIHHQFPVARRLFATIVYTGRLRPKGAHQRVGNSQVELCESVAKSII